MYATAMFFMKKTKGLPKVSQTVEEKKTLLYKKQNIFKRIGLTIANMGLGKERIAIIQNLAMMVEAGLQITDALKTLEAETPKKPVKKIMQRITQEVENGNALWRAMDRQEFFTPYAISLIRIGEESGSLAKNLQNLAVQDEKSQAMKQKVKTAMIYPIIIICLTVIIGVGLSWFVLPQLVGVLYALNADLPATTLAVIAVSEFFTRHGTQLLPVVLVGGFLLSLLMKFTPLRYVGQWIVLHIPGIKQLICHASVAQFGIVLGSLLHAGVAPVEALDSLTEVTSLLRYKSFYQKLTQHIKLGDSFAKSFAEIRGSKKVLPISVQQIIVTGERSGKLSDVLLKIADIYQKKAEETAQVLPIVLEPMLLMFVAGLVAIIAFAIIMPIYSVVGHIGGQ